MSDDQIIRIKLTDETRPFFEIPAGGWTIESSLAKALLIQCGYSSLQFIIPSDAVKRIEVQTWMLENLGFSVDLDSTSKIEIADPEKLALFKLRWL